jgi:hypothetical protein
MLQAFLLRIKSDMRKYLVVLTLGLIMPVLHAASPVAATDWKAKVNSAMPLLGHRNWILIVDSAYPLQVAPGIETVETGTDQLNVVRAVLQSIQGSIHVRPDIFMDAELPYVPESEVKGVTAYQSQIGDLLHGQNVETLPHDRIIGTIDQAGKTFRVLVLKTTMTILYSSVFIRLDCKYWSADAEKNLRAKMSAGPAK